MRCEDKFNHDVLGVGLATCLVTLLNLCGSLHLSLVSAPFRKTNVLASLFFFALICPLQAATFIPAVQPLPTVTLSPVGKARAD